MKTVLDIDHLKEFKKQLKNIVSIDDEDKSLTELEKFLNKFKAKYWQYVRDEDDIPEQEDDEEEYDDDEDYDEDDEEEIQDFEINEPEEYRGDFVTTDAEGVKIFTNNVFQSWRRVKEWIKKSIDEDMQNTTDAVLGYIVDIENLWKYLKDVSLSDGLPFSTMPKSEQDRLELQRVDFLNELIDKFLITLEAEINTNLFDLIETSNAIPKKIERLKYRYEITKKYNLDISHFKNQIDNLYIKYIGYRAIKMIDKIKIEIAVGNGKKKEKLILEAKEKYRQDIEKYGFMEGFIFPDFEEFLSK